MYFSAAMSLKPDYPSTYLYIGISLSKMGDYDNSKIAFEKAIKLDPEDHNFYLNYSITLLNMG